MIETAGMIDGNASHRARAILARRMAVATVLSETGIAFMYLLARVAKEHGAASSFAFGATAMVLSLLLLLAGGAGSLLSRHSKPFAWAWLLVLCLFWTLFGSIWLGFFSTAIPLLPMIGGVAFWLCLAALIAEEGTFQSLEKGFSWPPLLRLLKAATSAVAVAATLLMLTSSLFGRWQIPMIVLSAGALAIALLFSLRGGQGSRLHRNTCLCLAGGIAASLGTMAGGQVFQIFFSMLAAVLAVAGALQERFRLNLAET